HLARSWRSAQAAHPITGRGIGYKLFILGLILSMETKVMQRVYRLLKEARERGIIPWKWLVDETRSFERMPTWDNPDEYAKCVAALIGVISGTSNPSASSCGVRRVQYAECCSRFSTTSRLGSASCMGSPVPPLSMTPHRTM